MPDSFAFLETLSLGTSSAGSHALRIVADAGHSVSESNESDNEYTKTTAVTDAGACFPLTTSVLPHGSGTITRSQGPACSSATATPGNISSRDDGPGPRPGKPTMAAQSTAKAQRVRAFAALTAKARAEGRVRVIVGLKTEGRVGAAAISSFRDAAARSTLILRAQQALLIRMSGHSLSSIRKFKYIPYVAMELDAAALEALASDPRVVSIEEDKRLKLTLKESTPLIGAPAAWSQGFSGSGQTLAILDTGVDKNHPFLAGKVVSEACYSGSTPDSSSLCPGGVAESTSPGSGMPCSDPDLPFSSGCFHGTHVAGIAAGKGPEFSGVARDAKIISIQVFSKLEPAACFDGEGGEPGGEEEEEFEESCIRTFPRDVIAGLERVLELSERFDIAAVNASLGGPISDLENCDADFPATKAAIDNLRAVGISTIAASGNEGASSGIGPPACISSTVSVGSTDDGSSGYDGSSETTQDVVSNFSNSSASLDLLAPGRWITSSIPGRDGFLPLDGTSMAAPHVTGAWAVLKSKTPHASVQQVLSALKNTGKPITDPRNNIARPRIQVDAALNSLTPQLSYTSGASLTLTATANPGFRFKRWTGCDSVSGNRCIVRMNSGRYVSALFEPVAANEPDLLITSLTAPPAAAIGDEVSIAAEILNQGSADAGPFQLGFYLLTLDFSDVFPLAGCAYDSGLEAGRSSTCSDPVSLPASITPGIYFLGGIVDVQKQVAESNEENNTRLSDSGSLTILEPPMISSIFVPVILTAAGRNNSFFTSELTLTNRGSEPARLDYTYTAHVGGGSGAASEVLEAGRQKIERDALGYLRRLGIPIPPSGNRLGTLRVGVPGFSEVGVLVRTTTAVAEGRAGLAYPGVPEEEGFEGAVYLCGLRQNRQDRSNVAFQNLGSEAEGAITVRTTVYSGESGDTSVRVLKDVTLEPGGFHQYSEALGRVENGYVKVERVEGKAPFYAYGIINDQANSDGSFVFPVTESSLAGTVGQTLPVMVETGVLTSELTVTNVSRQARTLHFSFVAEGIQTDDHTADFTLSPIRLEAGQQRILPDIVNALRRQGVEGIDSGRGFYAGAVFVTAAGGDMSGVVIGARTGSPAAGGGRYGVFYHTVPYGAAFSDSAWIDALQQNQENRSNLALVNTGTVDDSESVFSLEIYDGETGLLANTLTTQPVAARRWHQLNSVLGDYAPGTGQGYVRIRKLSGNNPFLVYGVVNDGGAPGQRSGDGAYIPARE